MLKLRSQEPTPVTFYMVQRADSFYWKAMADRYPPFVVYMAKKVSDLKHYIVKNIPAFRGHNIIHSFRQGYLGALSDPKNRTSKWNDIENKVLRHAVASASSRHTLSILLGRADQIEFRVVDENTIQMKIHHRDLQTNKTDGAIHIRIDKEKIKGYTAYLVRDILRGYCYNTKKDCNRQLDGKITINDFITGRYKEKWKGNKTDLKKLEERLGERALQFLRESNITVVFKRNPPVWAPKEKHIVYAPLSTFLSWKSTPKSVHNIELEEKYGIVPNDTIYIILERIGIRDAFMKTFGATTSMEKWIEMFGKTEDAKQFLNTVNETTFLQKLSLQALTDFLNSQNSKNNNTPIRITVKNPVYLEDKYAMLTWAFKANKVRIRTDVDQDEEHNIGDLLFIGPWPVLVERIGDKVKTYTVHPHNNRVYIRPIGDTMLIRVKKPNEDLGAWEALDIYQLFSLTTGANYRSLVHFVMQRLTIQTIMSGTRLRVEEKDIFNTVMSIASGARSDLVSKLRAREQHLEKLTATAEDMLRALVITVPAALMQLFATSASGTRNMPFLAGVTEAPIGVMSSLISHLTTFSMMAAKQPSHQRLMAQHQGKDFPIAPFINREKMVEEGRKDDGTATDWRSQNTHPRKPDNSIHYPRPNSKPRKGQDPFPSNRGMV